MSAGTKSLSLREHVALPTTHILFISFFLMLVASFGLFSQTQAFGSETPAQSFLNKNPEGAVARLSDSEVRRLLLKRLVKEESEPKESFNPAITAWRLQRHFGTIQNEMSLLINAAPDLPGVFPRALDALNKDRGEGGLGRFIFIFLGALLLGAIIEFGLRQKLKDQIQKISARAPKGLGAQASALGILFILDTLMILAFLSTATIAYFLVAQGDDVFRTTFVFYMSAVAMIRIVIAGAKAFLAPSLPNLRIPLFSDGEASVLQRAILITVVLGAFGFFTCALFGTLGIGGDVHHLLLILVGTMITTGLITTIVCGRQALSLDLTLNGQSGDNMRLFLARAWPWFFAIIVALIWIGIVVASMLGSTPLYGAALFTIGLLFLAPSGLAALEREARRRLEAGEEVWPAVLRALRIGLAVLFVFLLAVSWRLNLLGMAGDGLGGQISSAVFQVLVTILVTYIFWQVARIWIDRKITEEDNEVAAKGIDVSEMEIGGAGLSRIRTLLPLLKRTIQIALSVIAFIIILSALGVDIGPVLAGAGVLGIAVGFGSQALVRDIVSGIFFLLDDAFRLGEYVEVGNVKGSVEKISLRSFQLRHHRGAVNTVPFGEIHTLGNYSRDWAIMKLPFRISFGTDIDKVRKVLKKVGRTLLEHPDVGEDFIQPLKSQGVLEVDDYGLVIRAKFMCKPGRQFLIRRFAFMAVQQAFAENGIEFARPEIRVVTNSDDEDDDAAIEATKQKASAAALNALAQK